MKCTCGFENAADARFCGKCRLPFGTASDSARPAATAPSPSASASSKGAKAGTRQRSRFVGAMLAGMVVLVGAGYWWTSRSPGAIDLMPLKVDGKYGFMDPTGQMVIAAQFDAVRGFSDGLAAVRVGAKWGFINGRGELVITPQFDEPPYFSEGLAHVRVGTKSGYIDRSGLVVITPQFDDAAPFRNGWAAVKLCCGRYWNWLDRKVGDVGENRYGVIDKDGEYVGPPGLLYAETPFRDVEHPEDAMVIRTADDQIGVMDHAGAVVIIDNADEVGVGQFTDGLAPVGARGRWGYVNTRGEWIIAPQFERAYGFRDGVAAVTVGQRTGLVDRKGKFVVNPQYDHIYGISEGYAIFQSGKGTIPGCRYCANYGFIDLTGRVVVEAKFVQRPNPDGSISNSVLPFSEGLAAVKTDDGWGFIDPTGDLVIPPQFDEVESFSDGLAFVTVLGEEAYITKTGAFVVEPFPGTTVQALKARLSAELPGDFLRLMPRIVQAGSPASDRMTGLEQHWVLEAAGTHFYTINVTSGEIDPTLSVTTYDRSGAAHAVGFDDGGGGTNARFAFCSKAEAGLYVLTVRGLGDAKGDYSLAVDDAGECSVGQKNEEYYLALTSDLKRLASAEEVYYSDRYDYTTEFGVLGFTPSPGVRISLALGDGSVKGWSAIATHDAMGSAEGCTIYYGNVTPPSIGDVGPGRPIEVRCTRDGGH